MRFERGLSIVSLLVMRLFFSTAQVIMLCAGIVVDIKLARRAERILCHIMRLLVVRLDSSHGQPRELLYIDVKVVP